MRVLGIIRHGACRWAAAFAALWTVCLPAQALPSFARQTGMECVNCHFSWPELTAVGRQFKLGGYTLMKPVTDGDRPVVSFDPNGNAPYLPLAAFAQLSATHTANVNTGGTDPSDFAHNDDVVLQQLSLFLAGRASDHAGGFIQWTYDGVARHSSIDNTDLRVADRYRSDALDVSYGLSLNNSPTMSDVYNTTPVWGFPYAGSSVAPVPSASTLIQGGLAQQVAGLTAYALWNRTLYTELGGYRTADGVFSVLRAGIDRSSAAVLEGTAPYARLALQHDWDSGTQSAMVGLFGLQVRKYPDPTAPVGATDRFRDVGVDAQYQYVGDVHRVSAQLSLIDERQDLDATYAASGSTHPSDRLRSIAAKASWYYETRYGISLGYQRLLGTSDAGLYSTGSPVSGSLNGSPNSSAVIGELNWLAQRDRRFALQYTAYQTFNGSSTNYDGNGRNARDNNTLYLLAWFAF